MSGARYGAVVSERAGQRLMGQYLGIELVMYRGEGVMFGLHTLFSASVTSFSSIPRLLYASPRDRSEAIGPPARAASVETRVSQLMVNFAL